MFFGAGSAADARLGFRLRPDYQELNDETKQAVWDELGEEEAIAAWAKGAELETHEAARLALDRGGSVWSIEDEIGVRFWVDRRNVFIA